LISLAEVKREAAKAGVDVAVIEKDYVLSWVLKGIYESALADNLVFKGGTALRKVYFIGYRFSEDLDFTLIESVNIESLRNALITVCKTANGRSGLELSLIDLKQTRSDVGEEAFEGKIQYIGSRQHRRGNPARIKLDLTAYENVLLPSAKLPLQHRYSDKCEVMISAYRLEEILAEKLRTIIQRAYPRDLYDCRHILKNHINDVNLAKTKNVYIEKCRSKNVAPAEWQNLLASEAILGKETAYYNSLSNQIKEILPFSDLLSELSEILSKHFHSA